MKGSSMRIRSMVMGLLAVALPWGARASKRSLEGEAHFHFHANFQGTPRVGQPVVLGLMVVDFAGYPDSIGVEAHLDLPRTWELLAGDTTRNMTTRGRTIGWAVTVRPTVAGRFELRRRLRIDRGRFGFDEGEMRQTVDLRADSAIVDMSRDVRLETVRGGRRFRYGGLVLVPIDGPEDFVQDDLTDRARVLSRRSADCPRCSGSDPDTVSWIVFVAPGGRVRNARLQSMVDSSSASVAATRSALGGWTFSPGRVGRRQVADWLIVHVPVAKRR
ncbi:MAG TPA: hypothetical protein VGK93_12365 [Candidatus Eisenbacteria bacterium]|jgi:hypothetical protein